MSDTRVTFIPSMSLAYEDNLLESVGIGGELYRRDTPLVAENARLKAESARLRELVRALDWCTENFDSPTRCDRCPLGQTDSLTPECEVMMRELGVKEDE